MSNQELRAISFFISLPDALDVPDSFGFPIYEIDDGTVRDAFHFIESNGVSTCWRMHLTFFQSPTEQEMISNACFQVFDRFNCDKPNGKKHTYDSKTTVVKATYIVGKQKINKTLLSSSFDELVSEIARFQKAYFMCINKPIELVTMQNTSPMIPYIVEIIDSQVNPVAGNKSKPGLFFLNEPLIRSGIDANITQEQLNKISNISNEYSGTSLEILFNVRREALLAYQRGNAMLSVLLSGMAAEILLDELLLMLLWEEGTEPRKAHEIFNDPNLDTTSKRIDSGLYEERLMGQWSLDCEKGALRNWRYRIRDLRNKIIHVGYEPNRSEMSKASDALNKLTSYICDLLCNRLSEYPITAILLVGIEGMRKRGCGDEFDEIVSNIVGPTRPLKTFSNWQFEVERNNHASDLKGNYKKADLILMLHENGQEMWLLQDVAKRLAIRIPDQIVNSKIRENINRIIETAPSDYHQNILIQVREHKPKFQIDYEKEWMPSYMVNSLIPISRWPISYLPPEYS